MPRRADRIAHVVQAVEEGDEIEALAGKSFAIATSNFAFAVTPCCSACDSRLLDRGRMEVVADEVDFGNAFAMRIVENPCPQPTSATFAPRSSFAGTPSSAGSQDVTRLL